MYRNWFFLFFYFFLSNKWRELFYTSLSLFCICVFYASCLWCSKLSVHIHWGCINFGTLIILFLLEHFEFRILIVLNFLSDYFTSHDPDNKISICCSSINFSGQLTCFSLSFCSANWYVAPLHPFRWYLRLFFPVACSVTVLFWCFSTPLGISSIRIGSKMILLRLWKIQLYVLFILIFWLYFCFI